MKLNKREIHAHTTKIYRSETKMEIVLKTLHYHREFSYKLSVS